MIAFVTGGTGALGRPAVTRLREAGHTVRALARSAASAVAPTAVLRSTLLAEEEVARFVAAGGRGVVLRMAGVYVTYSAATRDVLALARRGLSAFAGPSGAYQSLVWDPVTGTRMPRRRWSRRP